MRAGVEGGYIIRDGFWDSGLLGLVMFVGYERRYMQWKSKSSQVKSGQLFLPL
ncbi:hypothetical protein EX30DRAFT_339538 [Ascodesmis nigricans]|uniref:Uncharacterized protein n=1 Tax=Ascodesmis nigricans TaxID=341454 RepID=A0A4S2N2T8_9PEZI|nr:hypothetical protein EX30DRAFT_339538 [Ascodesmis nigricans]